MDDILQDDGVRHLLDECEKAMRLYAQVKDDPRVASDVKAVADALFRDLGRTVYNLYWTEPGLPADEQEVAIAEITSEQPTAEVEIHARRLESVGDFGDSPEHTDLPVSIGISAPPDGGPRRWYTDEAPATGRGLHFTETDGLEEALPGESPTPQSQPVRTHPRPTPQEDDS